MITNDEFWGILILNNSAWILLVMIAYAAEIKMKDFSYGVMFVAGILAIALLLASILGDFI